jgi:hypothetical protein
MSFGKLSSLVSIRERSNELLYQSPESTLTKGEVYINNKDSFPIRVRVGLSTGGVQEFNSSGYVIYNLELNPGESYKSNTLYFKDGQSLIVYGTSSNISFNLIGVTTSSYSTVSGLTTSYNIVKENTFESIYEFPENSELTNVSICNKGTHQSKVNVSIGSSVGEYIIYNHRLDPSLQIDLLNLKVGINQKIFVKSSSPLTNFVVYSE